jgi:protein-S-isoprenylcysteine O-methyltransferase Ste14
MHKLRHLRAILALPLVALCVIPGLVLFLLYNVDTRWNTASAPYGIIFFAGIVFLLAGMILLVVTVYLFATVGEGTLAPWDPTQKLVVEGPYRYVRNPMITGVLTVLVGESIVTGSLAIALLAAFFFVLNHVYFIFSEEPGLIKRFGQPYKRYMKNVPRWVPRSTPWVGDGDQYGS